MLGRTPKIRDSPNLLKQPLGRLCLVVAQHAGWAALPCTSASQVLEDIPAWTGTLLARLQASTHLLSTCILLLEGMLKIHMPQLGLKKCV